jgi:hypothetical protein
MQLEGLLSKRKRLESLSERFENRAKELDALARDARDKAESLSFREMDVCAEIIALTGAEDIHDVIANPWKYGSSPCMTPSHSRM